MTSRPVCSRLACTLPCDLKVQGFGYLSLVTLEPTRSHQLIVLLNDMMLQMTVKKDLGLSDAEANERLTQLAILLPGLLPRLPTIKARTVVIMAQDISVSRLLIIVSWRQLCERTVVSSRLRSILFVPISSGSEAADNYQHTCRKWRKSLWKSKLFFLRQMLQVCSCNGPSTS